MLFDFQIPITAAQSTPVNQSVHTAKRLLFSALLVLRWSLFFFSSRDYDK
jgi:hypothetical protein